MYDIKTDPHTHTIFSGHAHGTLEENLIHAAEAGMQAIAMTDHFGLGGKVSSATAFGPNFNSGALPYEAHGVVIISGIEIDIADMKGNLVGHDIALSHNPDMTICESVLNSSEMTIASLHFFDGFRDGTKKQYTQMFCNAASNPGVDIIGHCGRSGVPFDIDELLITAKHSKTLIEINEHSFDRGDDVVRLCRKIAMRCAELGVDVSVASDAHSSFFVGKFPRVITMLEEIRFPEELIANLTLERLRSRMKKII